MVQRISAWLTEVNKPYLHGLSITDIDYRTPLTPWIHPPVPLELQGLIRRLGYVRSLEQGEPIFEHHEKISHIVMVTKGVTARSVGNPEGQSGQAIALSVPEHLAAGNLNIQSGRPAVGRYFALTPAEVIICSTSELKIALNQSPLLQSAALRLFEECMLSDRLGFLSIGLLSMENRMRVMALTWANYYGQPYLDSVTSKMWIRMPTPMTRDARCRVISTTRVSLDNCLKKWKKEGLWFRDGDFVDFPVSLIENVYAWLRQSEEPSLYSYPETAEELFQNRL